MKPIFSDSAGNTGNVLLTKAFLICGILSSLLYMPTVFIGANAWDGYNSASQSISELIAIDAPSTSLVIPLFVLYSILIYTFGIGIWRSAGRKRTLRIMALLIAGKEVLGLAATLFAPMHLRGAEKSLSDTMHIVLTAVGTLFCMFPAMIFAASASGKSFRIYTIATILLFLVFGVLAGLEGPRVAANLPTPLLGVWERINVFGYMLWIVVLAIVLLRVSNKPGSINGSAV
jgi:hypothetical protein